MNKPLHKSMPWLLTLVGLGLVSCAPNPNVLAHLEVQLGQDLVLNRKAPNVLIVGNKNVATSLRGTPWPEDPVHYWERLSSIALHLPNNNAAVVVTGELYLCHKKQHVCFKRNVAQRFDAFQALRLVVP